MNFSKNLNEKIRIPWTNVKIFSKVNLKTLNFITYSITLNIVNLKTYYLEFNYKPENNSKS